MLKFFRLPFATSGDKTAVPDPIDTNGNVSYTQGYGLDYQRQKTDPAAKNIERDKMNQIFFDITTALAELQSQGVPDFITSALNGGGAYSYAQNAIVKYSGDLYISLAGSNTALPSDATKWALLPVPARLQSALNTRATAGGTADALTGTFTPAIAALPSAPDTLSVMVRAGAANTITNPTFQADATAAKVIVKGANSPLVAGDIAGAGHWLHLDFDATLDRWVLQNPATAGVTSGQLQSQTYTAFTTAGATGAFTLTPSPAIGSYAAGQRFRAKFHAVGNGSDTINVSGIGAKNLKQYDATGAKVAPVIASSQLADIEYDGTDFVILDSLPAATVTTTSDPTYTDNSAKPASTGWVRGALSAIATGAGFAASFTANGYVKFPSWLGGFVIEWGKTASINANSSAAQTFPLAFPTSCFSVVASSDSTTTANAYVWSVGTPSTTGFTLYNHNTAAAAFYWLAVGV